jgi:hypothetical protein
MAAFASATFTGTAFTELSAVDANWTKQSGYSKDLIIGSTGAYLICNNPSDSDIGVYRNTTTPPSADYTVAADIATAAGSTTDMSLAVTGRAAAAADTYYFLQYNHASTQLRLFKRVAGSNTQLGSSYSMTLTGTPVRILLEMDGDQIAAYVDGVLRIGPVTDTAITAAGFAGARLFDSRQSGVNDAGTFDNWAAEEVGGGGGAGLEVPRHILLSQAAGRASYY